MADGFDGCPKRDNERTGGGWGSHGEPIQHGAGAERDVMLVGVKGCSTTACVAGWAAALSGWHPTVWTNGDTTFLDWQVVAPVSLIPSYHYSTKLVYDLARTLLGITDPEAEELFSSTPTGCSDENRWTADDLRAIGKGRSVFTDEWPGEDS